MKDPVSIHDPNFPPFVQDFGALADLAHERIDHDRCRTQHERISSDQWEFTTEWQIELSEEMAHSP